MAVLSIKIKTHTAQYTIAPGALSLTGAVESAAGTISMYNSIALVYMQATEQVCAAYKNKRLIRSIQHSVPHSDGRFFLLGDACTQFLPYAPTISTAVYAVDIDQSQAGRILVYAVDAQDPESDNIAVYAASSSAASSGSDEDIAQASYAGLVVLDQCPACNDCATKWSMLQRIQTMQLIIAAAKDNQLYSDATAQVVWQLMDNMRITQAPGSCAAVQDMDQRSDFVLPARRLFVQYKALVQMWNFLVRESSHRLQLRGAAGHPQGLALALQRRTTQCYDASYSLELTVTAAIISGQVPSEDGSVQPRGICLIGKRLGVYAHKPDVTYALDADASSQAVSYTLDNEPQAIQNAPDRLVFRCTFTDLTKTGVFGLSVTLLPYEQPPDYTESDGSLTTLYKYQTLAAYGTQVVLGAPRGISDMPQYNLWQVTVQWRLLSASTTIQSYTQTKTYSTPLCKVAYAKATAGNTAQVLQSTDGSFYIVDATTGTHTTVYPVLGDNDVFQTAQGTRYKNII